MALVVVSFSDHQKPRRKTSFRADRKPWLLKDYLLDDLSSCSSSGFRSFPRRQCCAATGTFLINPSESYSFRIRRKASKARHPKSSSSSSKFSSALKRVSLAVINAAKLLSFKSVSSPTTTTSSSSYSLKKSNKSILPRSLVSRKLFSRTRKSRSDFQFQEQVKKDEDIVDNLDKAITANNRRGIDRWISSTAMDKYCEMSDLSTATTMSMTIGNSDSWSESSDSDFGPGRSSGSIISSIKGQNGLVFGEKVLKRQGRTDGAVITAGSSGGQVESSSKKKKKHKWAGEEKEKEQLSPVSVQNFPDCYLHELEDDQEAAAAPDGNTSPFTRRHTHLHGTKERLVQKLRRFERLSNLQLDPVNLHQESSSPSLSSISLSEDDHLELQEGGYCCSRPEEEDQKIFMINRSEAAAERLLKLVKTRSSSRFMIKPAGCAVDNLLFDFFVEGYSNYNYNSKQLLQAGGIREQALQEEEALLRQAEDWLMTRQEPSLSSSSISSLSKGKDNIDKEIIKSNKSKIKLLVCNVVEGSMELEGGVLLWNCINDSEREELVLALEVDILTSLIQDLLDEINGRFL